MSQFGLSVIWCAVQVTCLAAVAAALYALATRRGAAAASFVAVLFLNAIIVLTALAFCPLPEWWTWTRSTNARASVSMARSVRSWGTAFESSEQPLAIRSGASSAYDDPHARLGGWRGLFAELWRLYSRDLMETNRATSKGWSRVIDVVFLVTIGLSLARFSLGLRAIAALRRRSSRVDDADLTRLVETLRLKMGCGRSVALHESTELATAAAIGWWSPTVLLPVDWRTWSDSERQAVLAHELAHIRRADFLTRLVAQFSAAIHFYHPLVLWFVSQLRLQQELAADLLGAEYSGGRTPYLRTLAQMALRQEQRTRSWPARTFLPTSGTLMRRIHMLRVKEGTRYRSLSRASRTGLALVLAGGAVCLSALRSPATQSREDALKQPAEPVQQVSLKDVPTVMLGNEHMVGVVAIRPAALFNRPGMQRHADTLNRQIAETFNDGDAVGLKIEEIAMVSGPIYLKTAEEAADGKNVLGMFIEMMRATENVDWKQRLEQLLPDLTEIPYAGHTYYKSANGKIAYFPPGFPPGQPCFIPDSRTLVFPSSEQKLREFWDEGREWKPLCESLAGWSRIQSGFLSVAIDNRGNPCGRSLKEYEELAPLGPVFQHAVQILFSVEASDKVVVQVITTSETVDSAKIVAEQVGALRTLARNALQEHTPEPATNKHFSTYRRFAQELLDHLRVEREGTEVRLRAESTVDLPDLAEAFLALGF